MALQLAVTGLPKPQPDHASRMVRFADSCMTKMSVLLVDLCETLGEDTSELQFRVGLHSGPVTAGVLRGQKGRFQLFGDTVNVAARMESNGVPGRIHVSEATANELKTSGKESWLTLREDKIVAKGKGELTTYFAVPRAGSATTIGTGSSLNKTAKSSEERSSST